MYPPAAPCQRIPPQDQAALKTAQDLLLMQQSHRSHNEMVQECFMDCVKVSRVEAYATSVLTKGGWSTSYLSLPDDDTCPMNHPAGISVKGA